MTDVATDLSRHLERELLQVLRRHVNVMMLTVTPHEGQVAIAAAVGVFAQYGLVVAASLSGMDKVGAAYDAILRDLTQNAASNRDLLVSSVRETCAPAT